MTLFCASVHLDRGLNFQHAPVPVVTFFFRLFLVARSSNGLYAMLQARLHQHQHQLPFLVAIPGSSRGYSRSQDFEYTVQQNVSGAHELIYSTPAPQRGWQSLRYHQRA